HSGWPALASGVQLPARRVWKQVRPLEPTTTAPPDIQNLPIPKDPLARARRVQRPCCPSDPVAGLATQRCTGPNPGPDPCLHTARFTSFVVVVFRAAVPALDAPAGSQRSAVHTAFAAVDHGALEDGGPWSVELTVQPDRVAQTRLGRVAVAADGALLV